jgi:CheY-like chemotaxis protein
MNTAKKILIVDDDARNIFALKATLQARGFICLTATDAKEAKKLMIEHADIGLVLIDMMMPEIDGYEAILYLRATSGYNSIPMIAVTAQAMLGDREKCLAAGASDYVSKPIDIDKLMLVIEQYLA